MRSKGRSHGGAWSRNRMCNKQCKLELLTNHCLPAHPYVTAPPFPHQRSPRSRSTVSTKACANVPTSSALAPYLICRTVISRMSWERGERGDGGKGVGERGSRGMKKYITSICCSFSPPLHPIHLVTPHLP